jgi:hypothetical protein
VKLVRCAQCGSNDLVEQAGYVACTYCRSRFALQSEDLVVPETVINMSSDVQALLQKCESDPGNRARYAGLILDIDPTNREVTKYLN